MSDVNKQLVDVLKQIKHSLQQGRIIGNDYRREMKFSEELANEAISAAEQDQKADPVAWCELTRNGQIAYFDGRPIIMTGPVGNDCHPVPLYAHPPAVAVPAGYVPVPDAENMTDGIAEAIARECNCCGGRAYEIYCAMLAAAQKGGDA